MQGHLNDIQTRQTVKLICISAMRVCMCNFGVFWAFLCVVVHRVGEGTVIINCSRNRGTEGLHPHTMTVLVVMNV